MTLQRERASPAGCRQQLPASAAGLRADSSRVAQSASRRFVPCKSMTGRRKLSRLARMLQWQKDFCDQTLWPSRWRDSFGHGGNPAFFFFLSARLGNRLLTFASCWMEQGIQNDEGPLGSKRMNSLGNSCREERQGEHLTVDDWPVDPLTGAVVAPGVLQNVEILRPLLSDHR